MVNRCRASSEVLSKRGRVKTPSSVLVLQFCQNPDRLECLVLSVASEPWKFNNVGDGGASWRCPMGVEPSGRLSI